MKWQIPEQLAQSCQTKPSARAWLEQLPSIVTYLQRRWSLTVHAPFVHEDVSAAWVAPVTTADGEPAVLKVGLPHMEAEHEIAGLRLWDGDCMIRLLEADDTLNAMLLERCLPGTALRALPSCHAPPLTKSFS